MVKNKMVVLRAKYKYSIKYRGERINTGIWHKVFISQKPIAKRPNDKAHISIDERW